MGRGLRSATAAVESGLDVPRSPRSRSSPGGRRARSRAIVLPKVVAALVLLGVWQARLLGCISRPRLQSFPRRATWWELLRRPGGARAALGTAVLTSVMHGAEGLRHRRA